MSEVKRYEMKTTYRSHESWDSLEEDKNGRYVNYEDYAALQAKCTALATENAAFKDINAWCKTDAFSNMYREFKTAEAVGCCNIDCMHDAMVVAIMHAPETPATDAFLAEVRAQGVDMFAQWCRGERDFTLIDEDVADAAAYEECVKRAEYFSVQIRKGGEQK